MARLTSQRLWQRTLGCALLLALVLAPMLGQLHRALHGSGQLVSAGAYSTYRAHDNVEPAASSLAALFSSHQASDCVWLDQLALADAAPSAPAVLAHSAPEAYFWADTPLASHWQRSQAAFETRAPPFWWA